VFIYKEGSASRPSLCWPMSSGVDIDSGLWHPADGQIGVSINGTNRATFFSGGLDVSTRVYTEGHFRCPNNIVQLVHAQSTPNANYAGGTTFNSVTITPKQSGSVTVRITMSHRSHFSYGSGGDSVEIQLVKTTGGTTMLHFNYMGLNNDDFIQYGGRDATVKPYPTGVTYMDTISAATTYALRYIYASDDQCYCSFACITIEEIGKLA
jgi:hypothetical protein